MLLTALIFLPIAALLPMAFLPARMAGAFKWLALAVATAQLGLAVWCGVHTAYSDLAVSTPWISLPLGDLGALDIRYALSMDGPAFMLVFLTVLISWIALAASWGETRNTKAYFMLFMLLDASLVGVFLASDFFLFFLFYEFMLLPVFFLIGLWGGERREYAAIKFFIYTLAGSVFMLLVMAALALSYAHGGAESGAHTLLFADFVPSNLIAGSVLGKGGLVLGLDARSVAFLVLFVAFAIKVPVVPLHTWLPDAHVEAPTPVSVMLAGVLLKVGGYGIWRVCFGFFPEVAAHYSWWIGLLGVVSVLYGALVAMGQTDFKRMIAYSSVSHMGYVLVGLASRTEIGTDGALFQLFTHGLISSMLFLLVGVLYDRTHDRTMSNFAGLWGKMPRYTFFVMIAFFASLGLPGLCAFVSEVMIFMGAVQAQGSTGAMPQWMALLAVIGIILSAVYYLRAFRQMFFGKFLAGSSPGWEASLQDLSVREYLVLVPLAILTVLLGIAPNILLHYL